MVDVAEGDLVFELVVEDGLEGADDLERGAGCALVVHGNVWGGNGCRVGWLGMERLGLDIRRHRQCRTGSLSEGP